jgi:competence protein ComFC
MLNLREAAIGAKGWFDAAISFFYPEVCQYCEEERATAREGFVGPNCQQAVKLIERPYCERCGLPFHGAITSSFECGNCRDLELHFSKARAAASAEGMLLEIIHRYKYNRALWFEPFLAGLLVSSALANLQQEHWDMIVPVPLHKIKRREREFNQAERLARRLSDATQIPLECDVLERVQATRTQTRLTRRERQENVRKAFALFGGTRLNGERIVLVDDVFTTGATTSACAKVLRDSGAGEVCVWALARGGLN